ncbi:hypothetical protein N9P68_01670 [Pseudomonadales bacterium]|nr:hypothetical protein [Pseudomonadales bacterium]
MKLNELPKTFWTDTRADALERQKATMLTRDFRKTLKDLNASHSLYALTISTTQSSIHRDGIWFDYDARNKHCGEIYHSLIHRLSSEIEPNYKRNTHADKRIISWGVFEHKSRGNNKLCLPHIHATLAVHPAWEQKFLSCFQKNLFRQHFSPSQDFQNRCMNSLMPKISSIRLEPIFDEFRWSTYCLKQVPLGFQAENDQFTNTDLFTHDGLNQKLKTGTGSKRCA